LTTITWGGFQQHTCGRSRARGSNGWHRSAIASYDLRMGKLLALSCLLFAACGSDGTSVNSNEAARRAYLGLDKSVSKSLELGFAGYDAATSANIPPQTAAGDAGGMLNITGKVDQGNPNQATMTLDVGMVQYTDGKIVYDDKNHTVSITYDTSTDVTMQPVLNLKLNASANNSISGTLVGDYKMSGDLKGTITLDLTITGMFSGSGTSVMRVPGTTTVTGTAVNSSGGMYTVDVTL
jgi:hypothetical protein